MKILLLACLRKNKSGNSFGGAEKSIINLANYLTSCNYDVTVACIEGSDSPFEINSKVKVLKYNFKEKNKLINHYQLYLNTKNAIEKTNADLIISFWIHPLFYSILIDKNSKKIYSERNDPSREYGIISKFLRKIMLRKINGVVFQTKEAQNYFDKEVVDKSIIIHNPVYIQYDKYSLVKKYDNRVVTVGRLVNQKNFSFLINCFHDISQEYSDLILEIYGEGPLKSNLQKQIDSLNMHNKIFLMGAHKNVIDKIYGAKIFVLCSNYEGMPNALMEAMCLGIPVISSDCPCGGPRELIENYKNGLLFNCNDKYDFINKFNFMMKDANLNKISKEEKKICNTHSQKKIYGSWINYINKIGDDKNEKIRKR